MPANQKTLSVVIILNNRSFPSINQATLISQSPSNRCWVTEKLPWIPNSIAITTESRLGIGSDRCIHHVVNKPLKGEREFVRVLRLGIKDCKAHSNNSQRVLQKQGGEIRFSLEMQEDVCLKFKLQVTSPLKLGLAVSYQGSPTSYLKGSEFPFMPPFLVH